MWYNALMFYAELSNSARLIEQASDAAKMALTTKQSIIEKFYDKDKEYFANSFDTDGNKDFTCSPKQLTAYALPYAVADNDMSAKALPIFEKKLLTPVGLRNMDPDDPRYATEGSITPWYLGYLVELYLRPKRKILILTF
jgi:glycogen debranching enzyme